MFGIHRRGLTLTSGNDNVADDTQFRAALGPRARSLRPQRPVTAFTDATLLRELVARLERADPSHDSLSRPSNGGPSAKPQRWCGASPLARKHAAWRQRRERRG